MTFFSFIDRMKSDPTLKVTRSKWKDSKWFIFWDSTEQLFLKNYGHVVKEWCSNSFIDDLQASDWAVFYEKTE